MYKVEKKYRTYDTVVQVKPFIVFLAYNKDDNAFAYSMEVAAVDAYQALNMAQDELDITEAHVWFHQVKELHYFNSPEEERRVEEHGPMILEGEDDDPALDDVADDEFGL